MRHMLRGGRKGVLFTLLIVVLFLLMITELVSYVIINITFDRLATGESVAFGASTAQATFNAGASVFLGRSLKGALNALVVYAGTPSIRNGAFINDTSSALESLMTNGIVYGANMVSYNAISYNDTLNAYVAYMKAHMLSQGENMSLVNTTLTVYQGSPYYLNVSYTALAIINSSQGSFNYPLAANASIPLNGTMDLYSVEAADPREIRFQPQLPKAVRIGNTFAIAANTLAYTLAYGTVVNFTSPTCLTIPTRFQNANYILMARDASHVTQNVCGMGGVIANTINTVILGVPNVGTPYLVYTTASNVIGGYIKNGTKVLISSPGKEALNVSALQDAINNGYYFASAYTPSYLEWAQGNNNARSSNGMFSLYTLNRRTASLNPSTSSYIDLGNPSYLPSGSASRTLCGWGMIYSFTAGWEWVAAYGTGTANEAFFVGSNSAGTLDGGGYSNDLQSTGFWVPGKWEFACLTYDGTTAYLYGNGKLLASGAKTWSTVLAQARIGQQVNTNNEFWNGRVADVQIYNSVLSPQQINTLYVRGIDGVPINSGSLVAWYPLNGNPNDYSGRGNNGASTSVVYTSVGNYIGDPIYGGSMFYSGINVTEGVLNCGTSAECSSQTLPHLYLRNTTLVSSGSVNLNESAALNLANAIIPS